MPLSPGVTLPKDMDQRQFSRWCKEQSIVADDDSVGTAELQDEAVTLAKIQNIAADRIMGRLTSSGVMQELTAAQVATLIETALEALNYVWTGTHQFDGNVGFYGQTPVSQQASPTALSMGTVSGTGDDSTININFSEIETAVNQIRSMLQTYGFGA